MDPKQIFDLTFPLLYRFFYYKSVNRDEIDDLCQETFQRFFNKYTSAHYSEVDVKKILYKIARFVWLEWMRSNSESHLEFNEEMDFVETYEEFSIEVDEETEQQSSTELHEAIKLLHPVTQQVITLRFIEGKSRREIAEQLAMSEKSVHVYQRRGIVQLKKLLERSSKQKTVSPLA